MVREHRAERGATGRDDMTIGELIRALQRYPDDLEVVQGAESGSDMVYALCPPEGWHRRQQVVRAEWEGTLSEHRCGEVLVLERDYREEISVGMSPSREGSGCTIDAV